MTTQHNITPASVVYITTEPADYFQGWPVHYYAVSPDGTTGDIKHQLLAAVAEEEVFINDHPAPPEFYDELERSVCELFAGLDLSRQWYSDDEELNAEVQSHFGILMGRWADWVPDDPKTLSPEEQLYRLATTLIDPQMTSFARLAAMADALQRAGYLSEDRREATRPDNP